MHSSCHSSTSEGSLTSSRCRANPAANPVETTPLVMPLIMPLPPKSYGSLFPYYNFIKYTAARNSALQFGAMAHPQHLQQRHSIAASTANLTAMSPPTDSFSLSARRRLSSLLHLHIPEPNRSHITLESAPPTSASVASHLHILHLPTFTLTGPSNENKKFSFAGIGIRRHSNTTLHRSESMVSLCFRSLAGFIADDNFSSLQSFLENKQIQVDDRDENGTTALMLAATKGRLQFVRELLAHGAEPNAEDSDGWTALLCAAKEGHADICLELISHGADVEHRDMGGWTALMWSSYKGRVDAVSCLLEKGADVNAHGNYHISSLLWAAGRGYTQIVQLLVLHGAKVNVGDKYGTSALVWACRRGHVDIVECLLKAGANVDTAGMYSWTPLLVATLGNYADIVNFLLDHKPNVNALDKDGCTALTIACKEGYYEIAVALLNAGAYINIQDRAGDTNLIHAVKGNHRGIVEALLKKYADVDITGKDRKTAIYNSVEKGNIPIVKLLLNANPDLEIATKDGDTPLLRAVRARNVEIVQLLLEKKAKVSAADKKGDTALHIAMRARSKGIIETLLRNPKHSQLLYRPNRQGETPYNIDLSHTKPILGQIFGARRLNTNEDNENMLGYDLYSSALADILSEPSLSMPITVGLYAKWGSGKSFLLNKLREEMKNFAKQWMEPTFQFSSLLFIIIVHVSIVAAAIVGIVSNDWLAGLFTGLSIIIVAHLILAFVYFVSQRYDWDWPYNFNVVLTRKLNSFKLVLQIMFCHPPGAQNMDGLGAQPIKFYFTDQTRVSSTTNGENSVVQMLGSLYDAIESDYGTVSTRLYRAFRPRPVKDFSSWRWRRLCCLPYVIVFEICFICFVIAICVTSLIFMETNDRTTLHILIITVGLLLGVALVANLYTFSRMLQALLFSQRRHLQKSIASLDTVKSEGFLQALRTEVSLMTDMVKCLDKLTSQQTRLVVVVDGLDSCEQEKVLLVLDAVHMLFSDANSPFIVILAIDPHAISKVVEANSRRLFSESSIGGHDYLRNMVHLPFYLQNSGLRRVQVAQHTALSTHKRSTATEDYAGPSNLGRSISSRRLSSESGLMSSCEKLKVPPPRKGSRKLKLSDSIASSIGSNLNRVGGAHDLTKMLLTDDYFSDVNPRSMRRLLNVVYITGRLLKAFQIDFNWYHLASWVNITEQWPFRTSWIILYHEMHEDLVDDNAPLKNLYDKVRPQIPVLKEVQPLLELDRDEKKFDIFLTFHRSSLLISDLKIFLPFTINLDPYLKKVIKEEQQSMLEDESLLGATSVRAAAGTTSPVSSMWGQQLSPQTWNSVLKTRINRRHARQFARTGLQQVSPVQEIVYAPQTQSYSGWPNSHWAEPLLTSQPVLPNLSAVTKLPNEILEIKLSNLSVDGVCDLLNKISDITVTSRSQHVEHIRENNITGKVLLHCDLEELKKVLQMTFGDWELFRMMVVCLREQELSMVIRQDETDSKAHSSNNSSRITANSSMKTSADKMSSTAQPNESASGSNLKSSSSNVSARNSKQSCIEKQVTLEEQMICGALQTLNEEACEDVMDEGDVNETTDESAGTDGASSPGPPISISVPENFRKPQAIEPIQVQRQSVSFYQDSPGHQLKDIFFGEFNQQTQPNQNQSKPLSYTEVSKSIDLQETGGTLHSSMYGQNSKHESIKRGRVQSPGMQLQRPLSFPNAVESIMESQQSGCISAVQSERCMSHLSYEKMTPTTSLDKLKDRFLSLKGATGMGAEIDSDDESTPLVSDKSKSEITSAAESPMSADSVSSPHASFYRHSKSASSNQNLTDYTDIASPTNRMMEFPVNHCMDSPKGIELQTQGATCMTLSPNMTPDGLIHEGYLSSSTSDMSLSCALESNGSSYQLVPLQKKGSTVSVNSASSRSEVRLQRQNSIDEIGNDRDIWNDPETIV